MFIELHILQNFAPSNLNRDDTGNPKDTEFGGVRRARISSQCIKRATRSEKVFADTTTVEPGIRTRWLARATSEKLEEAGKSKEEADALAIAFTKELLGDMDKKEPQRSNILAYVAADEIQSVVDTLLAGGENAVTETVKKMVKTMGEFTSAPDVALFGRMLARKPTTVILDAACQVSHAISTHRANMEMDFYTAVDDLKKDDETGAGMMGVIPFNSACFYRYARIDWEQLLRNLRWRDLEKTKNNEIDAIKKQNADAIVLAKKTIEGFLRATISAVPTGKQNSFAAQNPPDFLLGVVRKDGAAWSLANAFEKPVRIGREGGYLDTSIAALDKYWGRLNKVYGSESVKPVVLVLNEEAPLENLKPALAENREAWIKNLLAGLE